MHLGKQHTWIFVVPSLQEKLIQGWHCTLDFSCFHSIGCFLYTISLPCILLSSENGRPFTSDEIQQYFEEIEYNTGVTPLWPQANSEAENLHETANKSNPFSTHRKQAMDETPCQLPVLTKLPTNLPHPNFYSTKQTTMHNYKHWTRRYQIHTLRPKRMNDIKAKEQADSKKRAQPPSELKIGDTVLAKQRKQNKLSIRFNPNIRFKLEEERNDNSLYHLMHFMDQWNWLKRYGKHIIWKLIIPPCCGWLCGLHFQLQ